MIDNFALAISHGLLMVAAWRLLRRPDLDDGSGSAAAPRPLWRRAAPPPPDPGDA